MRLHETDWDAPGGAATVEVDYPDAMIQDLVNWLRQTTAWRENPAIVERRMLQFNRKAADHRNAEALKQADFLRLDAEEKAADLALIAADSAADQARTAGRVLAPGVRIGT